jgi:hypothetical protein
VILFSRSEILFEPFYTMLCGGVRQVSAPHDRRRDGIHKKKGRLRCRKRPKSREETP